MTDIVEWLRHCSDNTRDEYLHELAGRAADEIERLQADHESYCKSWDMRAEIERLRARCEALAIGAETLRQEATAMCQNAMACAANHYGEDFALHGMPGWLTDSQSRIIAASQALAAYRADYPKETTS